MSFEHKKSLGQNFLNSDFVPKKMCDAAEVQKGDTVLEIGPGTGALTRELLARGATVVAIEADERAIEVLEGTLATEIESKQLILHHGDARELDVDALGLTDHTYKVVANIPYYLSGLLFRTILESNNQPNTLVFLIQKELAERIARDKKESLLSLSVKAFGNPTYVTTVKRGNFTPPPKVDSAILAISEFNSEKFTDIPAAVLFEILHLGFGSKRKQLQGNLSKKYKKEAIFLALSELDLSETVRAEDVPLKKWLKLTKTLIS
jgi:16S rRNA (adenine1518-N6/adenine1519-N6)-dimethyltransferase